ncbi:hypothetical protein A2954_00050 [Candidatus Roizmanbacteria bacterium RIFCSPLOWO2_01_FULL_37_12]|uniref:Uncharacterized protein n=1 Tax=Candidatus Roizmanbacteria bacterium RIFCSPLOWO2_01_FULL_37_12 TaxID=1802056 RepID=A0A1F7IBD4_9BACT|nr:MAG: hypothetical protein A3D76_00375 [Candidatus Roizmanbacteria bacterium RIFCSPHIGHO2_02_FULL_37_9b]OGK40675.1 MAG: hypothetical protein A2954_00050 [Candidatus Roizmanbacteria bacterium RIFCSPLOWO2_01_FULL_37_12]
MASKNLTESGNTIKDKQGKFIGAETTKGEFELVKLVSSLPLVRSILQKGHIVQVDADQEGQITSKNDKSA